MASLADPSRLIRQAIIRQVRERFNDRERGERPVPASDHALYPRGSVIWRVHGDVTTMMVGGVAALLTQMLHPAALAGVWDHSDVRKDMLGRLRRTARFIAVTTYGHRDDATKAIERVKAIHRQVRGATPAGAAYQADDPALLAWIHVAGAVNFLDGWRRYGEPRMSAADQDRYFAEAAVTARMLGADPVPETRHGAEALIADFRPALVADARTREFRDLVLGAPAASLREAPMQKLVMSAAADLLPPFARTMHGLRRPFVPPAAVRLATFGLAGTLRWAFRSDSYRG